VSEPELPLERPSADLLDTSEAGPAAIRGGVLRTGAYVAGLLLSLASVPLLVRHLGAGDFGRYATVLSLITLVGGLTEFGVTALGLREYASLEPTRRDSLMRTLLGMRLTLTLLGVVVAVGFAAAVGYRDVQVIGTAVGGAALVATVTQGFLQIALMGELRFGWVAALEFGRQFMSAALVIGLVLAGAGLGAFFAVPLPVALITLAATVPLVAGRIPFRPSFHMAEWWQLARDTLVYAASGWAYIAYFRATIIVMSLTASAAQTGYFATSFRILETLVVVPALMIGAVFPIFVRAARDDRERLSYAVHRVFQVSLIVGVWLALAVVLAAPFAIRVIGGKGFGPSVEVLRIQGFAIAATFVAFAAGYALLSLRRHRELLLANLVPLVASIVLSLLLVPPYQANGGAVATLVAELLLAGASLYYAMRSEVRLRPGWGASAIVLGSAGAAFGAGILLPAHDVLRVALATVVYFALLLVTGQIPDEVRHAAGDALGRLARR
jgi:O-antigen/teichoic acid export membrane protein